MQKKNKNKEKQSKWPLIISLVILLSLAGCYFLIPSFKEFVSQAYEVLSSGNKDKVSQWVNQFGAWGPVLVVVMMVLQMFLIVVPSPLLIIVAILAYGPIWGSLLSIASIAVASSVGYWIGRYLGEVTVDRLIGRKKEEQLEYYVDKFGAWTVIITRLSPLFSNDAISFAGGLFCMGYWKFIGATLAGITPLVALMAYLGENSDRLKTGLIWVSAVSLAGLIFYIIYDKRKRRSEKQ